MTPRAFYDFSKHDKLLNDYLVKLQSFETAAKELHARAEKIYECEEKSAECAAEIFSSCKDFIPTEYSTEEADIGSRYISKLEEQADGVVAFSSIYSNLADVLLNLGDLLRAYHRRHMLLDKFDRKLKEYISASGEKKELRKLEKDRIFEKVLEIGNHLKEDTEEEYKNIVQQFHSCLEEYAKGIGRLVARQSNTTESMVKASC